MQTEFSDEEIQKNREKFLNLDEDKKAEFMSEKGILVNRYLISQGLGPEELFIMTMAMQQMALGFCFDNSSKEEREGH